MPLTCYATCNTSISFLRRRKTFRRPDRFEECFLYSGFSSNERKQTFLDVLGEFFQEKRFVTDFVDVLLRRTPATALFPQCVSFTVSRIRLFDCRHGVFRHPFSLGAARKKVICETILRIEIHPAWIADKENGYADNPFRLKKPVCSKAPDAPARRTFLRHQFS